jgi:hypothetical protein
MDTPLDATTLTREQLYELVWSTPMLQLAKRFGLSGVGLAKICRKYNIPRPTRGHWAKKEFGKEPPRAPLPPAPPGGSGAVIDYAGEPEVVKYGGELEEIYHRAKRFPPIVVDRKGPLHPGLQPYGRSGLPACVWVGKKEAPRAIRIMNALFRAVEAVGGKVELQGEESVRRGESPETTVSFAGDRSTTIRIREGYGEEDKLPDRNNPARIRAKLMMDNGRNWRSPHFLFREGKKLRFEDKINWILLRLIAFAGDAKIERLQRAERDRVEAEHRARQEEVAKRRAALKARQDEENKHLEELYWEAECWHKSRLVREYIAAFRAWVEEKTGGPVREDSNDAQWLRWANAQADRLDPLTKSPPSVLDETI